MTNLEKDELLPWLIKEYGCRGGVEVGVRDGDNAGRLLRETDMFLYGVDIQVWPSINQYLMEFPDRFSFYHMASTEASDLFCEESLDFIYIDAHHSYDSVRTDMTVWYPKLKKGGVFCGDDYCTLNNPTEGPYGIVPAVEEFCESWNVEPNISGIGLVSHEVRLDYAERIGGLHEDNLVLGLVGHMPVSLEMLEGRERTENVPVPQWWFIK